MPGLWWQQDGNCNGLWKVWFKIHASEAKTICSTCPVIDVCLYYGMSFETQGERHYVYGGATSGDRDKLGLDQETAHKYYIEVLEWYRDAKFGRPARVAHEGRPEEEDTEQEIREP